MRTEILIGLRDDAGIIGPVSHRLPVPGDRIGRVAVGAGRSGADRMSVARLARLLARGK